MRKVLIEFGSRSCCLCFKANTTMGEMCNTINDLDFFKESIIEIEDFGYEIDVFELGENVISADNGIVTVTYTIEDKIIIYA